MRERPAIVVGSCVLVIGATVIASCTDESAPFAWRATFDDASIETRAAGYEASIVRGGCASSDAVYTSAFRAGTSAMDAPDRLEKGRYGFRVRALDATCATIAEGCDEADVPLEGSREVHVTMRATSGAPRCEIAACAMGVCTTAGADGGVEMDAMMPVDAGEADASAADGASTDAIAPDAPMLDARTPCPDAGCTRIVVSDVVRAFDGGMGRVEEQHRFVAGAPPAGYAVAVDEAFFAYATPCPEDTFELFVASSETAGASDWVYTVFPQERDALVDAGFRAETPFACVGSAMAPPAGTVAMRRFVNVRARHGSFRFVRDDLAAEREAVVDAGYTEDVTETFVVWTVP